MPGRDAGPRDAWRSQSAYPSALEALGAQAPDRVFWRGRAWSPAPRAVAIVGSRRASEGGRRWAWAVAVLAVRRGFAVVSGGALGIDGAAHAGALAAGGRTAVVLPSPVHQPSPERHRPLFEAVVAGGGTLLSAYARPLGRRGFSERNQLIAALAERVVVVEARAGSGTGYTRAAAEALGRPVLARAYPGSDPRGEAARGWGGVRWVDTPEAALDAIDGPSLEPARPDRADAEAPSGAAALWARLEAPTPLEGLRALHPEAEALLFEWELAGRVERSGGRYRRVVGAAPALTESGSGPDARPHDEPVTGLGGRRGPRRV